MHAEDDFLSVVGKCLSSCLNDCSVLDLSYAIPSHNMKQTTVQKTRTLWNCGFSFSVRTRAEQMKSHSDGK